jgi:putative transposase
MIGANVTTSTITAIVIATDISNQTRPWLILPDPRHLFLLSEAQMRRIEPYLPLSHGIARRDRLRHPEWAALARCATRLWPSQDVLHRFVRWSRLGVFNKIFAELARNGGTPRRLMIDATHLKAHRTAASLLTKGLPDVSGARKAA